MKKIIYLWGPVMLWAFMIFYLSSQRAIKTSDVKLLDFIIHKIAHIIEYSIFSILCFRAVNKGLKKNGDWKIPLAITIIYAATDEVHQLFIQTREGRLRDILIDAGGGSFGIWLIKNIFLNQQDKLKRLLNHLLKV